MIRGMESEVRPPTELTLSLAESEGIDPARIGSKAANLAKLLAVGLPVPAGFVIPTDSFGRWEELEPALLAAADALGGGAFAVRSSASAEDLAGASYAGQYDTFLDVPRGGLVDAVRRCWESSASPRVDAYAARLHTPSAGHDPGMAVLVQRMVHAQAAGVAFSANPLSGARDEVVVAAVKGLGERLVSGEAVGDQWLIRNDEVTCSRSTEAALDADQARGIAALARRVGEHFGSPQDIEWALANGDDLFLLQARPMTSLPDPVQWLAPGPGYWMRNFRLGEWLPEPMTPLFEDWLLELIEDGYLLGMRRTIGTMVPFEHAVVNGWYFTAPPTPSPALLIRALWQSRGRLVPFMFNVLIRVGTNPEAADRDVLSRLAEEWRIEVLPGYRDLVQKGVKDVDHATPDELVRLIDRVGRQAGQYLFSLAVVGGSAWKMEGCLAKFFRQYLANDVAGSVQTLLQGLPGSEPELFPFAVQSVDWYRATAGELGWSTAEKSGQERHDRLIVDRAALETQCRAHLASAPRLLAKFDSLLEVTQRYSGIREQQARHFTLGWPLLRRSALRLGELLQGTGTVEEPEDIFFLTRDEALMPARSLDEVVRQRRAAWEQQRRLIAPLDLGSAPRLMKTAMSGMVEAVRTTTDVPEGAIVGEPASPGRAVGQVRIVRGPEDFDRFQPGEVLVAQATAPAWTGLFARAAAVVTDGGTLAAHASLVAREYGIPAVVATRNATARLRDGQVVAVDGGAGFVELLSK